MGVELPPCKDMSETIVANSINGVKCELFPLNKVGNYCKGENDNTTLPLEFNEVKSVAILDSGVGVAIATKKVWESWGKLALRRTRMKL